MPERPSKHLSSGPPPGMDQVFEVHLGKRIFDSFRIWPSPPALATTLWICFTWSAFVGGGGEHPNRTRQTRMAVTLFIERPKLSDPAHGTQRLPPRRARRVRCHEGF